jgi:hypothetical protein
VSAGDGSGPAERIYCIVDRCPGFAPAFPDKPVPADYAPAASTQTVGDWLSGQEDREMREERDYYIYTVAAAFRHPGLAVSAPTLTPPR